MIKTFFALALLSGSLSIFAEDISHYNDSTSATVNEYNRYNDTNPTYPGHYSDETSSSMSSTATTEPTINNAQYSDNTVTGTMGPGESVTDRYNKLHVGFLGGVNSPKGNDVSSSSEYGLDVGYQPTRMWNTGIEATTTKLDRADEARRTMALLKATTQLGEDIPFVRDMFFGAAGGTVVTDGKWRLGGGPLAGFDIPLTKNSAHDFLTLGANAKYIFTNKTPDSLIAALAVKYWF